MVWKELVRVCGAGDGLFMSWWTGDAGKMGMSAWEVEVVENSGNE